MCSVCGIATTTAHERPNEENVRAVVDMLRRTRHRGPDGAGLYFDSKHFHAETLKELDEAVAPAANQPRIVLGQSRLAITGSRQIDAQQPLVSSDGRLAMAHNGEVYNHRELAKLAQIELETDETSDSQILFQILERQLEANGGDLAKAMERTVPEAAGMYALAVTDGTTVVLARDAIGKKPLYFVAGPTRFAWASERKALVDVARQQGEKIRPLKPGTMLVCDEELEIRTKVIERLARPAIDLVDMDRALDTYEEALEAAVRNRTRGLTKAAVLFSGGIDSVLVTRMLQRAGVEVTGYVCGVRGSSDIEESRRIAKRMGLDVRSILVDADRVERWLSRIVHHTELNGPLMVEVTVPMWFAAREAHKDGHRVIFTGQAADELFGGYSWYPPLLAEKGPTELHARMWQDLLMLPQDTLEREDRITMAWALEMRAPFLDAGVIRTAFRISPHLKLEGGDDAFGKRVHRELAVRMGVPTEIAYRKKIPAQDGANLHDLLAEIGRRAFPDGVPAGPGKDVPDFGSIYRYWASRADYQTPEVAALLDGIGRRPGIVVAAQDGTATPAPREPPEPAATVAVPIVEA